jgi:hypothetical protein
VAILELIHATEAAIAGRTRESGSTAFGIVAVGARSFGFVAVFVSCRGCVSVRRRHPLGRSDVRRLLGGGRAGCDDTVDLLHWSRRKY